MGQPNVYNILSAAGAALSGGAMGSDYRRAGRPGLQRAALKRWMSVRNSWLLWILPTPRTPLKGLSIPPGDFRGAGSSRSLAAAETETGGRDGDGPVATRLSDLVIMTSDNPRSEKSEEIIKEIEAGAARKNYLVEPDRKEAIKRAVLMAGENDIVLIAGKGHETYQEIDGRRFAFNDREVLEESIKQLIIKNKGAV